MLVLVMCGLLFGTRKDVRKLLRLPYSNIYVTIPPWPGSAYIHWTIELIDRHDITPAERSAIYEGNAQRLMKLPAAR